MYIAKMNDQIRERWELWNDQILEDQDLTDELKLIKDNEGAIMDRFCKELEFGTGGLRGELGAGTNRMNIYTVAKASQGYSNYLNCNLQNPSVAIAYDSRIKSNKFAQVAAEVFAANGIKVYIYKELMPTPALSFAVRELSCSGGIVITASHNSAKYNGYKVYGSDGCQITMHAAKVILAEIESVDIFNAVKRISFEQGVRSKKIFYISEDVVTAFIDTVSAQSLSGEEKIDKEFSIVYSPLNGTGLKCITECLKKNGYTNLSVVKEQEAPDGTFPTCPRPNPENREALELGIRDAKRLGSELVLATDPDCDRVGIAVKKGEDYVLIGGNELGILLLEYICERRIALNRMPVNPLFIKTIATIDLAEQIAKNYGVEAVDVLTGFKFIGEQIGILEQKGEVERFIFGFEESYGYLTGSYVRDKDAVGGSLMICEMIAYYRMKGQNLLDVLGGLYKKYGYCRNTLYSYEFEGAEGFVKMQNIMSTLRKQGLGQWGNKSICSVSDYQNSLIHFADGRRKTLELPKSNVLKYMLEGNHTVVVRPSGTEPKLKLYFSVRAENEKKAIKLEKVFSIEADRLLYSRFHSF